MTDDLIPGLHEIGENLHSTCIFFCICVFVCLYLYWYMKKGYFHQMIYFEMFKHSVMTELILCERVHNHKKKYFKKLICYSF